MYFSSLQELEAVMLGHAAAFWQVSGLDNSNTFHNRFSDWLYTTHHLSCSAGWAHAIDEHCKKHLLPPVATFIDLVNGFLDQWSEFEGKAN